MQSHTDQLEALKPSESGAGRSEHFIVVLNDHNCAEIVPRLQRDRHRLLAVVVFAMFPSRFDMYACGGSISDTPELTCQLIRTGAFPCFPS